MRKTEERAEFSAADFRLRGRVVVAVLACLAVGLVARAVDLQVIDQKFLADEGDKRYMRDALMPAHRGAILDRNGEPIAVSSPVDAVWVNPKELAAAADRIPELARVLDRDPQAFAQRITSNLDRGFLYVARQLQPSHAARVKALEIPGVHLMREYARYYPNGEVTGHVLGFTNIDEEGQEGLELAYEQSLDGEDGIKRVIRDRLGRIVENVDSIRAPRPGEDLQTSIDLRIQYLAYRALKEAMREYRARAGSVVVLDVQTGEVLAMVNQPSFNPNDRGERELARIRNRAATDIFEPGSSIKPFIIAAAIASGKYRADSIIDTNPGRVQVGIKLIQDKHNVGLADMSTILAKSSNVGMAKIALSLDRRQIASTLSGLGFGEVTASGFPGESAGLLSSPDHWRPIGIATMSYGYGLSVTPLQLAQAYAVLGADGIRRPVTFQRVAEPPAGERVLPERVGRELVSLLERVVSGDGTGRKAAVPGYRVAGKTGTAWKASAGGYDTTRYMAVFSGVAPASRPRLAVVVVVDEPSGGRYYGGDVAAPVFSAVVSGALRLMSVAPDDIHNVPSATVVQAVP